VNKLRQTSPTGGGRPSARNRRRQQPAVDRGAPNGRRAESVRDRCAERVQTTRQHECAEEGEGKQINARRERDHHVRHGPSGRRQKLVPVGATPSL